MPKAVFLHACCFRSDLVGHRAIQVHWGAQERRSWGPGSDLHRFWVDIRTACGELCRPNFGSKCVLCFKPVFIGFGVRIWTFWGFEKSFVREVLQKHLFTDVRDLPISVSFGKQNQFMISGTLETDLRLDDFPLLSGGAESLGNLSRAASKQQISWLQHKELPDCKIVRV